MRSGPGPGIVLQLRINAVGDKSTRSFTKRFLLDIGVKAFISQSDVFFDTWYETHGVRGKVTKSGRKKKKEASRQSASVLVIRKFNGGRIPSVPSSWRLRCKFGSSRLESHAHRARQGLD